MKHSPAITADDLRDKNADEIRTLAGDNSLVPHPTRPDKWMDPVTGKERLRIDTGHVDATTGLPYSDPARRLCLTTMGMKPMERPRSSIRSTVIHTFPTKVP